MAKGELKTELEIVQEDSPELEIEMAVEEKPKRKRKARKKKESNDLVNELDDVNSSDEPKRNVIKRFIELVKDERTHKIFGLALVLFSVYTAVAIGSYFFTWQTDQDKVKQFSWSLLFDNSIAVNNALGRLGAFVSHNLIYNSFGIISAIWILFTVAAGITLMLKRRVFNLAAILKTSLLASVVCSTTLAFIFQSSAFPWGGAFGGMTAGYFLKMLGQVGTAGLLIASVLALGIWMFNIDFNKLIPKSRPKMMEDDVDFAGATTSSATAVTPQQTFATNPSAQIIEPKPQPFEPQQPSLLENIVSVFNPSPTPPVVEEDGFERVAKQVRQKQEQNEDGLTLDLVETPTEELMQENEVGKIGTQYDPTLDLSGYQFPSLDLLQQYGTEKVKIDTEELERNKDQIVQTLQHYNIDIQKIKATVGPTVTLYEIVPAPGVRISKIKNLEDDIALSLAALGIRIIAPIPGKGTIGIEVPNINKETVSMRTLLASEKFQHAQMELPVALGKTISNEIFVADLAKMPHLLMAGATGQGKSVGINAILASLLYKKHPAQLKFVMVDPKKVELSIYSTIEKHFLAKLPGEEDPIIVDTKKVVHTLKALCIEMDQRYDLLKSAGSRNLREYNEKFLNRQLNPQNGHKFLPYIVLVIDEFADLIMTAGKEVELPIARLAQLARAIGIHLIIATQRPSVNIITGTIKANFPARIAFRVSAKVDSKTILDGSGADQLIGRGDMLFSLGSEMIRLQCGFIDTPEVEKVVNHISSQQGYAQAMMLPEVHDETEDSGLEKFDASQRDDYFEEAAKLIVTSQQGSTSLIQRKLQLGYNRAGRLMDQLEAAGIVGPARGSKPREVLVKDFQQLDQFLNGL